jgi:hypothetical protein
MSDVEQCLKQALASWTRASETSDLEERIACLRLAKSWATLARHVLDGREVEAVALQRSSEPLPETPVVLH